MEEEEVVVTLYDLVVQLLGEPPNDLIMNLYYVLCIILVVFILKVTLNVMRSLFKVSKY